MAITAPEQPGTLPDDAAGVLAAARAETAAADRAEARKLQLAVQWAIIHPAESVEDAETYTFRSGLEGVIPIAGPGAPLVAEFSVAEYAAALGLSTEAGKHYLGQAVELRYRLPRLWARVVAGDLPAWKARRVADATIGADLTPEAATFVDQHVAPVAHKIRPTALDRLVEEAIGRFMPDQAEQRRRDGLDRRHFTVDRNHVSFDGTAYVTGELDLADAISLDDAVRGLATQLADLGSEATLDQRRALAVGELARRQLTLDLTPPEAGGSRSEVEVRAQRATKPPAPTRTPVRKTVLYLHLSTDALTGTGGGIGRCETTRAPVTATQIRDWCGHPDTHLVVQPVIDLNQHVHVDQYEIPHRITERVTLRDLTCVFPHCTRPARRLHPDHHGCDHDHTTPYRDHPETSTTGIAPLCRRHHRHKTHGHWHYETPEPGTYRWTSPHGHHYLRDHTGTTAIDPTGDARPEPDPPHRD
ncbi:13E12 repeat family protein [Nocardioides coralli]|uniref:13E12 repeat family protein n=1 Tax=Nocardioides coralli TaxID=2872154 RepID=UPI001CA45C09|nr:13E12 repeat family protein [Nocardioides coralli]QZY30255.1 13E12 repeat family protein [Nocardioides coralli]